ncbi:uncharacterized protein T069G_11113 [Trichoderma breve]|uniref:Uncharacterized protein n=1 Tax=Trichoderma breve TaxID=2034170 RepID=A0A9W9E1S1_9HYPO|nr:uncharacterized protein T069G_11113 [Trichoderma breve]KAJ4854134.1 hypothetical protein T069G_11113 [Trichoderma breve]
MDTVLQIPNTGSFLLKDAENGTMSIQLNPRSFTILRQAIIDGTSLPGNSPDFENRFNRGALQIFLERDPSVYDFALEVFIKIHQNCNEFKQVALHDLPQIGEYTANHGFLGHDLLTKHALAQDGNQDPRSALVELLDRLEDLSRDASNLSEQSATMNQHIQEFKVNTSGNYGEVKRLTEHWERAKMSDEEWHMRVGAKIKEMENEMAALEQKATDLDRQYQTAPSEDTPVWSFMKGISDALASTFNIKNDILRSREMLERDLKNLKRRYDELSDESKQQEQKFSEADGSIKTLQNNMHDLCDHSLEVATAIEDVNKAASRLVTDNEYLSQKLQYLHDDIEDESKLEKRLGKVLNSKREEITECHSMWIEVRRAGEKFRNGV